MGGSAPNSRCTLSSFPSVDIYGRLTEEFCRFAAILLCSGVTLILVEAVVKNFGGGFAVVKRTDPAQQHTIADLAHHHSLTLI